MAYWFGFLMGFIDCLLILFVFLMIKNAIIEEIKKQVRLKAIEISNGDIITVQDVQKNQKVSRRIKEITGTIDSILFVGW